MTNITTVTAEPLPTTCRLAIVVIGMAIATINTLAMVALFKSKHINKRMKILSSNNCLANGVFGSYMCTLAALSFTQVNKTITNCGVDGFLPLSLVDMLPVGFLLMTITIAIALSTVLLSLDRLLTLYMPQRYIRFATGRVITLSSVLVWVVASLFTIPSYYKNSKGCIATTPWLEALEFVCVTVIILVYIGVYINVKKHLQHIATLNLPKNTNASPCYRHMFSSTAKIGVIVLSYTVFNTPVVVYRTYIYFHPEKPDCIEARAACFMLFVLNSLIDPFIYVYMFSECRLHLARLFCMWNKKRYMNITTKLKIIQAPYLQHGIAPELRSPAIQLNDTA